MTAVRLTKTERALLEKATRNGRGNLSAMTWWSSSAKCTSHGNRAMRAIKSLVAKGLAEDLHSESNHAPNSDGWGSTHATEFWATITDSGRKALETDR